jgi:hypothetical protein
MALQLAYFINLDEQDQTKNRVTVQFNPTDLTFSKGASFAEIAIPGLDSPVLQFVRGNTETLSLDLLFDRTDEGMGEGAKSVNEKVDQFYSLVKQNPDSHAPPRLRFGWGAPAAEASQPGADVSQAPYWFTCICEAIDRKYLLFAPDGTPIRARVTVRLREYKTVEQMVAKLKSADHTKARILQRRERLDSISAEEYATSEEWRRIAEKNEIDDPRRIPPGTVLKIPPLRVESVTRRPQS